MMHTKPLSAKELLSIKKRSIFLFMLWQLVFALIIAIVLFFTNDYVYAYSFLLGCTVSIVPSFYMALRIFWGAKVRTAQQTVKLFYKGEAGKLIIAALLLALVFNFVQPLSAGLFFTGFGTVILSHWLSPVIIKY
ncbi:F0F1 ATP synthase assembly protein I [Marinomonas agarivorans]|nr:F0F1 ATP synthase assembly protein I [Marinomonas agarivorans]